MTRVRCRSLFAVCLAAGLANLNNRFTEALTLCEGGLALAGHHRCTSRRILEGCGTLSGNELNHFTGLWVSMESGSILIYLVWLSKSLSTPTALLK